MTPLQTGEERMLNYSGDLSRQLQRAAERLGLDIAETEALTLWASTVTANRSQSIAAARKTLLTGLKDLPMITNKQEREDVILMAILQAESGCRYAAIVRKPGKPVKVIGYIGR